MSKANIFPFEGPESSWIQKIGLCENSKQFRTNLDTGGGLIQMRILALSIVSTLWRLFSLVGKRCVEASRIRIAEPLGKLLKQNLHQVIQAPIEKFLGFEK